MRIVVERLSSKKGWVGYPQSAGRPSHGVVKVDATTRVHAHQRATKAEVVEAVKASVGFKPANLF